MIAGKWTLQVSNNGIQLAKWQEVEGGRRLSRDRFLFALGIAVFQLLVNATIALDIAVARQALGFIDLTLLPGMILLITSDIYGLDSVEKLLFSVGLSIAFVMFLGLVVSQIGLAFISSSVLSTPSLLLVINSVFLVFCVFGYFFGRDGSWGRRKPVFSFSWVLLGSLPVLAILGTTFVNLNGNSGILLVVMWIVALVILVTSNRSGTNPPLVLFVVTIALLLHTSLISNYLVGFDVHRAYHVFAITQSNSGWVPSINETGPYAPRLNQMLSATVFPTVYSNILNLEGKLIFKTVYPLVFALVPVGLFQIYQRYMQRKEAILAAFFILCDITFFAEMPGLPTQMIAEFFLVLSLIVILHEKISSAAKLILLTIFGAGIIVSHYGTSYVFMLILLIGWSILYFSEKKKYAKIRSTHIILYFTMALSWYIYTSQSASFAFVLEMGQHIYTSFWTDLLDPQSRTSDVLAGFGIGEPAVSIVHWLGRGLHYLTQFFIVSGVAAILLRSKTNYRFDREYTILSALMLAFVISPLVLPSFNLLNITRMYHMSLLFLAPFSIVGGELVLTHFTELRRSDMVLIVNSVIIASLFLFESGLIYEVTGDVSYSVPLSLYRKDRASIYGRGYLTEQLDVIGAQWLSSNVILRENMTIYADGISVFCGLNSYGAVPSDYAEMLDNSTYLRNTDAYVYLRKFNTFDGRIALARQQWLNTSDISLELEALHKIYSNGGAEIFGASG